MYDSDKWMIIKLKDGYKVFASSAGGYLDGDSWRLNSGITEIEDKGKAYYIHGESGSIYRCMKEDYGVAGGYNANVLRKLMEMGAESMSEGGEWRELINE